ncbi:MULTISPECIES: hypothetical protein [unclassified Streptomyces]|uniref:hypothetical protein n=1 Tax=unclassified Streptomyces TaxID=2593676 RepID=UPI002E2531DB
MNTASTSSRDEHVAPSGQVLAVRVMGAAATGAALTYLSFWLVDSAYRYDARTCAQAQEFCMTPWPLISVPASFVIALVALILVYRLLGIRPRRVVVPPTILLAPFPVLAAREVVGSWSATVVAAVWAGGLALTPWRLYRPLGLSVAGALLLAALLVLFR